MPSLAKQMVDSYGALIEVREGDRFGSDDPASLALGFDHGALLVSAVAEDDTICRHVLA
jgi:hypothetical protein